MPLNKALVGYSYAEKGGPMEGLVTGPGSDSVKCDGFRVAALGDAVAPHGAPGTLCRGIVLIVSNCSKTVKVSKMGSMQPVALAASGISVAMGDGLEAGSLLSCGCRLVQGSIDVGVNRVGLMGFGS